MKKLLKGDKEWLAARKQVITATEAPILLGLNPYSSPAKMWQEKTEKTFVGNSYTKIGQWLEPVVIQIVNEVLHTDFKLIENDIGKIFYQHPEVGLGATPDAVSQNMFLECKTTKPFNYLKYKYNPPLYYVVQLQTQLLCAGFDVGYLAIMSTDLTQETEELKVPITIFKVTKCNRLWELLIQEVKRFWDLKARDKMFRVDSKVKRESGILAALCYTHIK